MLTICTPHGLQLRNAPVPTSRDSGLRVWRCATIQSDLLGEIGPSNFKMSNTTASCSKSLFHLSTPICLSQKCVVSPALKFPCHSPIFSPSPQPYLIGPFPCCSPSVTAILHRTMLRFFGVQEAFSLSTLLSVVTNPTVTAKGLEPRYVNSSRRIFLSCSPKPQLTVSPTVPVNFGMLLFPAFQALDVFGPLDALNILSWQQPTNLYLVRFHYAMNSFSLLSFLVHNPPPRVMNQESARNKAQP